MVGVTCFVQVVWLVFVGFVGFCGFIVVFLHVECWKFSRREVSQDFSSPVKCWWSAW